MTAATITWAAISIVQLVNTAGPNYFEMAKHTNTALSTVQALYLFGQQRMHTAMIATRALHIVGTYICHFDLRSGNKPNVG